MKVLITGAAGFLGRWFTEAHLKRGDSVIGVDDLSNPHSAWPDRLSKKKRNICDAGEYLRTSKAHYDLAYHFAAPVGGRLKIELDPMFNADSFRLDSEFFRWAVRTHLDTVVYPSSSAVYGVEFQEGDWAQPLTESLCRVESRTWHKPDELYGYIKLTGEMLALKASKYGLNTLCIRPFSGYGEGQSEEYPTTSIALRALNHEDPIVVWGSGKQERDFVHVEDIVGATLARLEKDIVGAEAMNIGSGVPVTFTDVARTCAELVGYEPQILNDPSKPEGVFARYSDPSNMERYYHPRVNLRTGLHRLLEYLNARS